MLSISYRQHPSIPSTNSAAFFIDVAMSRKTKAKARATPKSVEGTANPAPRRSVPWNWLAIGVIAVAGVAAYYAWSEVAADRQFRLINGALDRYDYDAAADLVANYLQRRPTDPAALLLASQTARRRGDFDLAEKHLRAAFRADALPEAVDGETALLRVHRGDLTQADPLIHLCESAQGEPQAALALEAIFEGSIRAVRPSRAKWAVDRWAAFSTSPLDEAMGKTWLARLHEFASDTPAAIAELRDAVRLAPDFRIARVKLAEMLVNESPAQATEHIDWLLKDRPNDATSLLLLARKQRATGDPGKAAETLDRILKSDSDNAVALVERGRSSLELHQMEDAERFLRRAYALAPDRRFVRLALADCLREAGKPAEAEEHRKAVQAIDERLERKLKELGQGKSSP